MEQNPRCQGLDLSALLVMPIQRIPRYQLLLQVQSLTLPFCCSG
jgi:hypothetical protein